MIRFLVCALFACGASAEEVVECDLLVVGGTESGCAAAIQAARMGVESIVLVNDIEWLGGQFSAEALAAIDENMDTVGSGGYGIRHTLPIPRNGLFKEVIERIEALNTEKYGHPRPGNTRVITTAVPSDAAQVFAGMVAPYETSGQLRRHSWYYPEGVEVDGDRVTGVVFRSVDDDDETLTVRARLTIDASDWGDAIRLSGAAYEFGPDLKETYGEPEAPMAKDDYPRTDMNPITFTAVLEETDEESVIPKLPHYDETAFSSSPYPQAHEYFYASRRIIDRYNFDEVTRPDMILLCTPHQDYPLDLYPPHVAEALEKSEAGASNKNIVEMTREQRAIVFEDAKNRSLGLVYWLQTVLHDRLEDETHSFRRFKLVECFGTEDSLPFKPYVRESLRLKAMHMMRQQHTLPAGGRDTNFAQTMYYDGVACWQFEYDYHPTKRMFLDSGGWQAAFRPLRNWGPPYSGRAVFPIRSFIPERVDGLLGAQKNLGYSSIVSSAVRLHDQSMATGQACGAVAAVALNASMHPRDIPGDPALIEKVRDGLCHEGEGAEPLALWPYRDMTSDDESFVAVNRLSALRVIPIAADGIAFEPDREATEEWKQEIAERTSVVFDGELPGISGEVYTRGAFAIAWYDAVRGLNLREYEILSQGDADLDGIADVDDPMPYGHDVRLPISESKIPSIDTAIPGEIKERSLESRAFNFAGSAEGTPDREVHADGSVFEDNRGFGWTQDIRGNHRRRGTDMSDARLDTFVFTRAVDTWECAVENGEYYVTVVIGDTAYPQPGQRVVVEGARFFEKHDTARGEHASHSDIVSVEDGRLTIEIGDPEPSVNTCLNWVRLIRLGPP